MFLPLRKNIKMIALNKLDLTENVRYCLEKLADGTVEGKVIEFLYSIDLIDGQVKKGHHKEADMNALQKAQTTVDLEHTEYNSRELTEILGIEWTNCSNIITRLQKRGIAVRRTDGRKRYVSLKWEIVQQLHEAITNGRIVPAKELT